MNSEKELAGKREQMTDENEKANKQRTNGNRNGKDVKDEYPGIGVKMKMKNIKGNSNEQGKCIVTKEQRNDE
jgi:hypothetical protein